MSQSADLNIAHYLKYRKSIKRGTHVKADVQSYGIVEATVIAVIPGENDNLYQLEWTNTAWSKGGTVVSLDEIIEVLTMEA